MIRFFFAALLLSRVAFGAMTDTVCATTIVTNLKTLNAEITGDAETALLAQWTQICKGLILHIQTNAVVTVTGVQLGASPAPGTIQ